MNLQIFAFIYMFWDAIYSFLVFVIVTLELLPQMILL